MLAARSRWRFTTGRNAEVGGMIRRSGISWSIATLLTMSGQAAFAVEPLCGDVNTSGTVSSSDALLVLKNAVGQPVELECPPFAVASTCGNGLTELGEACDGLDLNGKT